MKKILFVIMTFVLSSPLFAEGMYIGAGVTKANNSIHKYSGLTYTAEDEKDEGFKLFLGKNISDHWGVELGYADLGTTSATVSGPTTETSDQKSVSASLVLSTVEKNNFSAFVKGGYNLLYSDASATDGTGGSETSYEPYYGIGLNYDFTGTSLRLEYESFGKLGTTNVQRPDRPTQVDVKAYSISLVKKF